MGNVSHIMSHSIPVRFSKACAINRNISNPYFLVFMESAWLVTLQTFLSETRWLDILQKVGRLCHDIAVTVLTAMGALRLLATAHPVVPLGLLHIRCLLRWFTILHLDPKRHKWCLGSAPLLTQDNIQFWGVQPIPLDQWERVTLYVTMSRDVPLMVLGRVCWVRAMEVKWPSSETCHIKLELQVLHPVPLFFSTHFGKAYMDLFPKWLPLSFQALHEDAGWLPPQGGSSHTCVLAERSPLGFSAALLHFYRAPSTVPIKSSRGQSL